MYIVPQPYRCNKCGHTCQYSQDDYHPAPALHMEFIACPKCWLEWLRKNIGGMEPAKDNQQPENL